MPSRNDIISAFSSLGRTLYRLEELYPEQIRRACRANRWFSAGEIYRAARAVSGNMLVREELERWSSHYRFTSQPIDVVAVLAGNIPFAGLFDLLCILMSGHRCLVKYSSKDRIPMTLAVDILRESLPDIPLAEFCASEAGAVIGSGSDNAIRHLRAAFGPLPALFRGNRSSVAIIDPDFNEELFQGLADDIFTYSGLGCRNVSHLLLPEGFDPRRLAGLAHDRDFNPGYSNNYRQRKAVLEVSGQQFTDCGGWLLTRQNGFSPFLCEITYGFYRSSRQAGLWVREHLHELQCVVASQNWDGILPFPATPFGKAQSPGLYDYPDRVDTMQFLSGL